MTKRPAVGIVLLSAALATGACSASVGTPQVDKSEVASQISTQLAEKIGEPPDDVTCPEEPRRRSRRIDHVHPDRAGHRIRRHSYRDQR